MSKTETREEWFCRIASDVVREYGLASLDKSMSQDLFRFIHFFQEAARAETRRTLHTSDMSPDCPQPASPANRTRHTQPAEV